MIRQTHSFLNINSATGYDIARTNQQHLQRRFYWNRKFDLRFPLIVPNQNCISSTLDTRSTRNYAFPTVRYLCQEVLMFKSRNYLWNDNYSQSCMVASKKLQENKTCEIIPMLSAVKTRRVAELHNKRPAILLFFGHVKNCAVYGCFLAYLSLSVFSLEFQSRDNLIPSWNLAKTCTWWKLHSSVPQNANHCTIWIITCNCKKIKFVIVRSPVLENE